MYRLIIHKQNAETFRIRAKKRDLAKHVTIRHAGIIVPAAYTIRKKAWELIRDLLWKDFGKDWRKIEAKHGRLIQNSIISAVKRAH